MPTPQTLKAHVANEIKSLLDLDNVVIEIPKDHSLGDFSTPVAFSLAKTYKKAPAQIAQDLSEKLRSSALFDGVNHAKGFINLRLSASVLDLYANDILYAGFTPNLSKNHSTLLEFVSANPTGPLHIGHARGAIFGQAFCNIGQFLCYDIKKEYYINDAGNQIDLLGTSVLISYHNNISKQPLQDQPEDYYRGDFIDDATKAIYAQTDAAFFTPSNRHALGLKAKDHMMDLIKQDVEALGLVFDYFIGESSFYDRQDKTMQTLKDKNAIYDQGGKTWIASSKKGDEKDRVLIKEDGKATYMLGDMIYHYDKFDRGYDACVNIWGADHHGYIPRIKASLDFMGYDSDKLEVLLAQMVNLLQDGQPYKMSKRKGNFVLLQEALELVGRDALILIFLSKKLDTHLDFDIASLSKQDASNPVFYIHYAHTRIASLLKKTNLNPMILTDTNCDNLPEGLPRRLLIEALLLKDVLESAFEQREINKVVDYLYNLSANLHSFYTNHTILGSPQEKLYIKLLCIVGASLKKGLALLGIQAKTHM